VATSLTVFEREYIYIVSYVDVFSLNLYVATSLTVFGRIYTELDILNMVVCSIRIE